MKRKRAVEDEAQPEAAAETIKRVGLRGVQYFVLDEADRMLDMGFMPQVREIVALMGPRPPKRQSLMFSATWPPSVHALAKEFLREPYVRISLDQGGDGELRANQNITQVVEIHRESKKEARLLELLREEDAATGKTLIFVNTKKGCAVLAERLRAKGFHCAEIHGNLPQAERAASLANFTSGAVRCLVATDVAARGLDVEDITLVVCFDFPDAMVGGLDDYVHRIGRTGRAGRHGRAVTFFPAPEDVSGTRSAGNAYELIKVLEAAGQEVSGQLRALDTGPPVPKAAAKPGKKGSGKGKGAAAKGSTVTGVTGGPAAEQSEGRGGPEVEVAVEGLLQGQGSLSLPEPIMRFEDAPFSKSVRRELAALGFQKPMPVQAYGWPVLLSGRDCVSIAKTGAGKTLAFLLPAFHLILGWTKTSKGDSSPEGAGPLVLVVAPTRELATQIHGEAQRFASAARCRCACAYGGAAWEPQASALEAGVELLVATPGRLAFLMGRGGEKAAALARTIAGYGARKQLSGAVSAFSEFCSEGGVPSRQIFSALMNAHVQSGDMAGAGRVRDQMKSQGFHLGVVECTTLLKGQLEAGDMSAANAVLQDMLEAYPPVTPDLRLVNTYLRGCVKLGEVASAIKLFEQLPGWSLTPDATTYKMLLSVYRQGLRLNDMVRVLKELEEPSATVPPDALTGLDNAVGLRQSTAEVACMLGQKKKARRLLAKAQEALEQSQSAWTTQEQFDVLRRKELALAVKHLHQSLEEEGATFDLLGALHRTFAFPSKRTGAPSTREEVCESLLCRFGIEECIRREMLTEADMRSHVVRCLKPSGQLRWSRVFSQSGLPVRLEVCSGSGDWVVAQAKAEAGKANWVASELRYDRAHSILTKMVLAGVENVCVLAGDAGSILQAGVPRGSISSMCVNFPQPPQTTRSGSCDEAESELHLLTPQFFQAAHAALAEGGVLTIFSDNQDYVRFLANTLANLLGEAGRLFVPFADVPTDHIEAAEEASGLLICEGCPGPEAGHAVQAESQFDRFFAHGQHTARWYLAVARA